MTRFRTAGHLASWCGRTPLDKQSGARKGQRRHKRGNKYITAWPRRDRRRRWQDRHREGARHRKISRKRGKAKAVVATGNTQMKVYHALLSSPGTRYEDLGPDYYERQRDHSRHVGRLVGELGSLGYEVTLRRKPQPEDASAT